MVSFDEQNTLNLISHYFLFPLLFMFCIMVGKSISKIILLHVSSEKDRVVLICPCKFLIQLGLILSSGKWESNSTFPSISWCSFVLESFMEKPILSLGIHNVTV